MVAGNERRAMSFEGSKHGTLTQLDILHTPAKPSLISMNSSRIIRRVLRETLSLGKEEGSCTFVDGIQELLLQFFFALIRRQVQRIEASMGRH
jgi:hypothetical protein